MSGECAVIIVMAAPSDSGGDDLVSEFFAAVRSGKCSAVISLMEANPGLIGSVEDAGSGDTALHLAVKACRTGERCKYLHGTYQYGTNQDSPFASLIRKDNHYVRTRRGN